MSPSDHPLLTRLTDDERAAVLPLLDQREVPAGTDLVAQDESPRGLHLLLVGQVEVCRTIGGDRRELAVLGPGSWFGELSLLDGASTAMADVTALTDVQVAIVPPDRADELVAIDAIVVQLDAVARRRRATNIAMTSPPVRAGTVEGQTLELRPLWPEDWRQLAARRRPVSDESLRNRFFNVPAKTERWFRGLTSIDLSDQFAWGAFLEGDLVGVGRHALQVEDRATAELAVLVSDDLHGHGVGSRLVTAVAAAADAHGASHLYAIARRDNLAVQSLLRAIGARWQATDLETVEATWAVDDALAATRHGPLALATGRVASEILADVLDA